MNPEISNTGIVGWHLGSKERKGWSKLVKRDLISLVTRESNPGAFEFIITKGDKEYSFYSPPSSNTQLIDEYIEILTKISLYRKRNPQLCEEALLKDKQYIKYTKRIR